MNTQSIEVIQELREAARLRYKEYASIPASEETKRMTARAKGQFQAYSQVLAIIKNDENYRNEAIV